MHHASLQHNHSPVCAAAVVTISSLCCPPWGNLGGWQQEADSPSVPVAHLTFTYQFIYSQGVQKILWYVHSRVPRTSDGIKNLLIMVLFHLLNQWFLLCFYKLNPSPPSISICLSTTSTFTSNNYQQNNLHLKGHIHQYTHRHHLVTSNSISILYRQCHVLYPHSPGSHQLCQC